MASLLEMAEWQRRINEAVAEGKEVLDLPDFDLGDEEMKYLSDVVLRNKEARVEELWLSGNKIGDDGIEYLSDALKTNETVQKLYLQRNKFSAKGIEFLLAAVRINTSLTRVIIYGNHFALDEATLQAVLDALKDMPARQAAREEYLALEASRMIKSAAKH